MPAVAITILQLFARYAPEAVEKIFAFAHRPNITPADVTAIRADLESLDQAKAIADARAASDAAKLIAQSN